MDKMDPYDPPLDKARHLRYWQRCVRTLLPHHYTSMDSTRLSLGFFIIAAIDLLSTTPNDQKPLLSPADRRALRRWVLSCQHPNGGFCGSPTHVFPRATQTADDDDSDSENAHLGGTYFALLLLALLADDNDGDGDGDGARNAFAGVDRVRTLRWLRRLQRPEDGSFGEAVYDPPVLPTTTTATTASPDSDSNKGSDTNKNNNNNNNNKNQTRTAPQQPIVAGGRDMRYCYLAASVRWMLRGDLAPDDDAYVEDMDVPALVAHIHRGQTYDGGFAESGQHESHAGYAYCAVAALAMLDRPLDQDHRRGDEDEDEDEDATPYHVAQDSEILRQGVGNLPGLVSFLMARQFAYLNPLPSGEGNDDGNDDDEDPETANFRLADLSLADGDDDVKYIGFNGRCNKIADTCYTWWTQGTLAVLGLLNANSSSSSSSTTTTATTTKATTTTATITAPTMPPDPASLKAQRAFLLDKTQHLIGGFGKNVGSPPDVGHGCLGLAALATMGDPSLQPLDPALCVSVATVAKVVRARRGLLLRQRQVTRRTANNKEKEKEKEDDDDNDGSEKKGDEFGRSLVDMAVSLRSSSSSSGGGGGGDAVSEKKPAWLDGLVGTTA